MLTLKKELVDWGFVIRRAGPASLIVECPPSFGSGNKREEWCKSPWQQAAWSSKPRSAAMLISLYWLEKRLSCHTPVILEPCHLLEGEMGRKGDSQEKINGLTVLGNQCPSLTLQAATSLVQMKQLWQYFLTKMGPTTTNKNNPQTHPGSCRTLWFCFSFTHFLM